MRPGIDSLFILRFGSRWDVIRRLFRRVSTSCVKMEIGQRRSKRGGTTASAGAGKADATSPVPTEPSPAAGESVVAVAAVTNDALAKDAPTSKPATPPPAAPVEAEKSAAPTATAAPEASTSSAAAEKEDKPKRQGEGTIGMPPTESDLARPVSRASVCDGCQKSKTQSELSKDGKCEVCTDRKKALSSRNWLALTEVTRASLNEMIQNEHVPIPPPSSSAPAQPQSATPQPAGVPYFYHAGAAPRREVCGFRDRGLQCRQLLDWVQLMFSTGLHTYCIVRHTPLWRSFIFFRCAGGSSFGSLCE